MSGPLGKEENKNHKGFVSCFLLSLDWSELRGTVALGTKPGEPWTWWCVPALLPLWGCGGKTAGGNWPEQFKKQNKTKRNTGKNFASGHYCIFSNFEQG